MLSVATLLLLIVLAVYSDVPVGAVLLVVGCTIVGPALVSGYIWASDDDMAKEFVAVVFGVVAGSLQAAAQLAGQYLVWVRFGGMTPVAVLLPAVGATSLMLGYFLGRSDRLGWRR